MSVRFGVLVFPGSNCDRDALHVITDVLHEQADLIWHSQTDLSPYDCLILPGGFAHGDYLRAGAIARFSPVMRAVERFAADGGLVWGICNGFQILAEAGLLPGVLLQNAGLRFVCRWVHTRVESVATPFTRGIPVGTVLRMPVAHHQGSYLAEGELIEQLRARGQIVLRYCDSDGRVDEAANPNGSSWSIAGVCSEAGNVFGLMPHPERSAELLLGSADGRRLFEAAVAAVGDRGVGTPQPPGHPVAR